MQYEIVVTVALPVWNAGRTLAQAIGSMLVQDFPDFELLVLDDGSTDDTLDIVASFDDPRIRLVRDGQRRGLASRLNQAIDLAAGRYLARMDGDDVSFPQRLGRQVAFLNANPDIDLLGCRAVAFRDPNEVIGLLPFAVDHQALCARPWSGIPLPHPGWMGRREWFLENRYRWPEVRRAEDQELLLRSYTESRFACLEDVLLGYRQGRFDLRRTWLARRSLLAAQGNLFAQRREWRHAVLAFAVTGFKMAVDVFAALPGCEQVFFRRMGEPAPATAIETLRQCLREPARSDR